MDAVRDRDGAWAAFLGYSSHQPARPNICFLRLCKGTIGSL
jgi:hypothetical protein